MKLTAGENSGSATFTPRVRADRAVLEVLGFTAVRPEDRPVALPLEKLTHLAYTAVARSLGGGKMHESDVLRWDLHALDRVPPAERDEGYRTRFTKTHAAFLKATQAAAAATLHAPDMLAEEAVSRAATAREVLQQIAAQSDEPYLVPDHTALGDGSLDQVASVSAGTSAAFAADLDQILDQEAAGLRK